MATGTGNARTNPSNSATDEMPDFVALETQWKDFTKSAIGDQVSHVSVLVNLYRFKAWERKAKPNNTPETYYGNVLNIGKEVGFVLTGKAVKAVITQLHALKTDGVLAKDVPATHITAMTGASSTTVARFRRELKITNPNRSTARPDSGNRRSTETPPPADATAPDNGSNATDNGTPAESPAASAPTASATDNGSTPAATSATLRANAVRYLATLSRGEFRAVAEESGHGADLAPAVSSAPDMPKTRSGRRSRATAGASA